MSHILSKKTVSSDQDRIRKDSKITSYWVVKVGWVQGDRLTPWPLANTSCNGLLQRPNLHSGHQELFSSDFFLPSLYPCTYPFLLFLHIYLPLPNPSPCQLPLLPCPPSPSPPLCFFCAPASAHFVHFVLAAELALSPRTCVADLPSKMGVSGPAHFVFLHGGGLGAWTWYRVVDLLRKKGHKASAIDLTSCGKDWVDPNKITSFMDYNQPFVEFMDSLPNDKKVILVGHDLGGLSVTYGLENYHQKVSVGVYIAAMMLPSRFPLTLELFELDPVVGKHIEYTFGDGLHAMPTALRVLEKMQSKVFYHLCPSEDIVLASLLSKPVPLRMLDGSCIEWTEEKYGTVPTVYMKTMHDRVLPPDAQDEAFLSDPTCVPSEVREIESDHSPFFSKPAELVQHLEEIAATYA